MQFQVTTQQGKNYIVSDDSLWIWIEVERELGFTIPEAVEKINKQSLDVITFVLHKAALEAGETELKTQKAWVKNEFDSFEVVEQDPKVNSEATSSE